MKKATQPVNLVDASIRHGNLISGLAITLFVIVITLITMAVCIGRADAQTVGEGSGVFSWTFEQPEGFDTKVAQGICVTELSQNGSTGFVTLSYVIDKSKEWTDSKGIRRSCAKGSKNRSGLYQRDQSGKLTVRLCNVDRDAQGNCSQYIWLQQQGGSADKILHNQQVIGAKVDVANGTLDAMQTNTQSVASCKLGVTSFNKRVNACLRSNHRKRMAAQAISQQYSNKDGGEYDAAEEVFSCTCGEEIESGICEADPTFTPAQRPGLLECGADIVGDVFRF